MDRLDDLKMMLAGSEKIGMGTIAIGLPVMREIIAIVETSQNLCMEFGLLPLMTDLKHPATKAAFALDAALSAFEGRAV